jgi:hypothetical protein
MDNKIEQSMVDVFVNTDNTKPKPTKMLKIESYDFVINFGKHNTQTIGQIVEENPSYVLWLHDNHIKGIFIAQFILNKALENIDKKFFSNNSIEPLEDDLPF